MIRTECVRSVIVLCFSLIPFVSALPVSETDSATLQTSYSVVLDAGSTGTRVSVFTFQRAPGQAPKFENKYHEAITPGLSSYGKTPDKCLPGIIQLVTNAQKHIPSEQVWKTPLMLRATAGLRLIPDVEAKAVLEVILKYFRTTTFTIYDDAVGIMTGRDEGLMSWLSVNLILDRLGCSANTVTTIDMGGGSTQVSLEEKRPMSFTLFDFVSNLTIYGKQYPVFSYSYLGLGIKELRRQVLELDKFRDEKYKSVCIHPLVKTSWKYKNVTYKLRGGVKGTYTYENIGTENASVPVVDINECMRTIRVVLGRYMIGPNLDETDVYAMSYFFWAAVNSKLTEKDRNININVEVYKSLAKQACKLPDIVNPFMCMDLLYLYLLLTEKYRISVLTTIHLVHKLKGHVVDWTLGLAFMNYQKIINANGEELTGEVCTWSSSYR